MVIHHKHSKIISMVMIIALLMNVVLPVSLTAAPQRSNQSVTNDVYGVTDSVYGHAQRMSLFGGPITENIITGITITDKDGNNISQDDIRIDQGTNVFLDFTWELPAGHPYLEGATFTFNLPDRFKTDRELEGGLGQFGTFTITPEGEVTFLFNDRIEGAHVQDGALHVERTFEMSKFDNSTDQELVFDLYDTTYTFPVYFKSKNTNMITKSGRKNKGMNPSHIEWTVDLNLGQLWIDDPVFKDTLPPGLQVDLDSVELYSMDILLNGSITNVQQVTDITLNPVKTVDSSGPEDFEIFVINLSPLDTLDGQTISKAYRLKYTTKITDTIDTTYTNKAELTGSNTLPKMEASQGVQVSYSKPLGKNSTGYNSVNQEITWQIEYNYNEQVIPIPQAYFDDTFNVAHQELMLDSFVVTEMSIDDNGNGHVKKDEHDNDVSPLTRGVHYQVTSSATGFELKFLGTDPIQSAFLIQYKTKAKDRVHEDNVAVSNVVTMPNVPSVTATQDIGQVIFKKSRSNVNYQTKEIQWTLVLNEDKKAMTNVVIEDVFGNQGLTYLPSRLTITGNDGFPPESYTVTADDYSTDPLYHSGIEIKFNKTITDKVTITYVTQFDPTYYSADNIKTHVYENSASLDWKETGTQQPTITKEATFTPNDYMKNNGDKRGSYNAVTKEITWTIDINYNRHHLAQAIVEDMYTGDQTFVPGSLTVNKLTIRPNGTAGNEVQLGALVSIDPSKFQLDAETNSFVLDLGEITEAYRITYQTSLAGKQVTNLYTNRATLHDHNAPTVKWFDKIAKVEPKHGDEYMVKVGTQGTGAKVEHAEWTIYVNRSQSTIAAGATITDTLSSNQILFAETIKVNKTNVTTSGNISPAGPLEEDKYNLEVNGDNEFVITFLEQLNEAYIVTYESFINEIDGETIDNDAVLQSTTTQANNKKQQKDILVSFSNAWGSAFTPGKGKIRIEKVVDGTSIPLQGAKFGLYNNAGTMLLEEGVTSADGVLEFVKEYSYRDYLIKELEAPYGYVIKDKDGVKITHNHATTGLTTNETIGNLKAVWEIELTKVDEDFPSIKLSGAEFNLKKLDETSGQYVNTTNYQGIVSDSNGVILLVDLEPGKYELEETEAPRGYQLRTTPFQFEIDQEQLHRKTQNVTNKIYTGSVELTKKDAVTGEELQGAVFELQDDKGNVVQSNLVTDTDGKIKVTGLRAGHYQFVETTAPEYYVLSTTPVPFEIIDDGTVQLEVDNERFIAGVKLVKTEKDEPTIFLSGAEFSLLDEHGAPAVDKDGQPIVDLVTDVNGELTVTNLRAGIYYFVETKAPHGYQLDATPIRVKVGDSDNPLVTVTAVNEIYIGSVELTKKDAVTGAELQGAVFELQDDKGNVVQSNLVTDTDGKIKVTGLRAGHYQFVETTAPEYYVLSTTPVPFEIFNDTAVQLDVENDRFIAGVKLVKTEQGDPTIHLSGAEFVLLDEHEAPAVDKDGQPIVDLVTDVNGELTVTNLRAGIYYFVETKAPHGYQLDTTPLRVKVGDNYNPQVTATAGNEIYIGAVQLTKKDAVTGEELQNAVFELQDDNGNVVQSNLVTDADGKIEVTGLRAGHYQFVEMTAPEYYVLSTIPVPVEIFNDTPVQLDVDNDRFIAGVKLVKTEKDEPTILLSGAEFALLDEHGVPAVDKDGQPIAGLVTNVNGELTVTNLRAGIYYFVETKAPRGYQLDPTPIRVKVGDNDHPQVTVTAVNEIYIGSVELTKKDAATGAELQGAVFELQDALGNVVQSNLVTDTDGKIKVTGLRAGHYQFVETTASEYYVLSTTPVSFEIFNDTPVQLDVDNDRFIAGVKLVKAEKGDPNLLLSGAEFALLDEHGVPAVDKDGQPIGTLITDTNGELTVTNLRAGIYDFVETKAPRGYQLDPTPIRVKVGDNYNPQVTVTAENEIYIGSVELTKKDAVTGAELQGAVFELRDAKGNVVRTNLVTDVQGKILVTGLRAGHYTFVETTAPEDYDSLVTFVSFEIINDLLVKLDVNNDRFIAGAKLIKTEKGDPSIRLSGAEFVLLNEQKAPAADKDGQPIGTLITDTNGELTVANLRAGIYYFVETKAPRGYQLDETPIQVKVGDNYHPQVTVTAENVINIGSVQLTKVDHESFAPLANAVFDLYDANGNVVHKGLRSDQQGKIIIPQLRAGHYHFQEVTAPEDYMLNPDLLHFELVDDGEVIQLTFTNELYIGSLRLIKIDASNPDKRLEGAEFRVLDADMSPAKDKRGALIPVMTTDLDGVFVVDDLKPGKYMLEEIKFPKGYFSREKITEFEIFSGKETVITVENHREVFYGPPIEPEGPKDPVDPTDSDKPVDPTNPVDPVDPTDPTEPVNPLDPADPADPTDTENPGDPTDTTDSVNPVDPADPSELEQPVDTTDPLDPVDPTESRESTDTDEPVNSSDPLDAANRDQLTEGSDRIKEEVTEKLPQTGEESQWLLQLIGFAFIAAGLGLLILRRRHTVAKS